MSEKETKYQIAQKRVRALRGFYVHLLVYVLVNLSLFLLDIITSPDSLWFYWPLLGWAIGITFHAFSVFGPGRLLGAEWEKRQIGRILGEGTKE